jgi:hypothetical protein
MTCRVPSHECQDPRKFNPACPESIKKLQGFYSRHCSTCDVDKIIGNPDGVCRIICRLRIAKGVNCADENIIVEPKHENYLFYDEVIFAQHPNGPFYDFDLPDKLTPEEKAKFTKTRRYLYNDEQEVDMWLYNNANQLLQEHGYDYSSDLEAQTRHCLRIRHETLKLHARSTIEIPQCTNDKILPEEAAKRLLSSNNVLLYVGSGVSVSAGIWFGKQTEKIMGMQRGAAVDKYVQTILAGGKDNVIW